MTSMTIKTTATENFDFIPKMIDYHYDPKSHEHTTTFEDGTVTKACFTINKTKRGRKPLTVSAELRAIIKAMRACGKSYDLITHHFKKMGYKNEQGTNVTRSLIIKISSEL